MIRRRALLALPLVLAFARTALADANAKPPNTLDALLERSARSPGLYATFTEDKQIALLAVPLRSEGTVHFDPARGLARHTLKPSPQSVLVTDKELVFWDGKTTKKMSLASSPTLETFARSFAMILTANRAALEKSFQLDFKGVGDDAYALKLTPIAPELKKMLASITIEGRGLEVSTLTVREANGDVSTTHFASVDTQKKYSAAEADRLFRVPPG